MQNKIVISESQKLFILKESTKEKLDSKIEKSMELTNKIIKDTLKTTGLDFSFLLTWGAGIGGFMGPVEDFISGKFPSFSSTDISLIMVALISTYFTENKDQVSKLVQKLKEKNLFDAFIESKQKVTELILSFNNFMSAVGVTIDKLRKMLSYTFIIPILPLLINAWDSGALSFDDYKEIGMRLVSYGVLTLGSEAVVNFIKKIFGRFPKEN